MEKAKLLRFLPRLLRLRDAPMYVGMDRNRFNSEVRPYLTEIKIGEQGIAFDRLEMDDWVDHYMKRNGRPGQSRGDQLWEAKKHRGSKRGLVSGMSTNTSVGGEFARALDQISLKRQSASSQD